MKISPERGTMTAREVCALTGISRASLTRLPHNDPTFPRPVVLGRKLYRWPADEVRTWWRSRLADREG